MKNEELVNNIVCKTCIVTIFKKECSITDKELCFSFNSTLQIANEKDKLLQKMSENELKQLRELEDYCSYEVSNLLSKKGFDYELNTFYKRNDNNKELQITLGFYGNYNKFNIPAPTHQMALKWLRDNYNIFIGIEINELQNSSYYQYDIVINNNFADAYYDMSHYRLYEDCVDNAIKYCLINYL